MALRAEVQPARAIDGDDLGRCESVARVKRVERPELARMLPVSTGALKGARTDCAIGNGGFEAIETYRNWSVRGFGANEHRIRLGSLKNAKSLLTV